MKTLNASKVAGAKKAALAKVTAWGRVQSECVAKKLAARAAGNAAKERRYLNAEIQASARRYKHEIALDVIDRWEREQAEEAAATAHWAAMRKAKAEKAK